MPDGLDLVLFKIGKTRFNNPRHQNLVDFLYAGVEGRVFADSLISENFMDQFRHMVFDDAAGAFAWRIFQVFHPYADGAGSALAISPPVVLLKKLKFGVNTCSMSSEADMAFSTHSPRPLHCPVASGSGIRLVNWAGLLGIAGGSPDNLHNFSER